ADLEPPVPAGLGQLNPSLDSFAEFLGIDLDLILAAAEMSPKLVDTPPSAAETRAWLEGLPTAGKDDLLPRLIDGEGSSVGSELVQRMRRQRANGDGQAAPAAVPRTVAELRRRGKEVAVERRRKAAVEAARRKAERERAAAQARTVHLDQLVGKEPALWAS